MISRGNTWSGEWPNNSLAVPNTTTKPNWTISLIKISEKWLGKTTEGDGIQSLFYCVHTQGKHMKTDLFLLWPEMRRRSQRLVPSPNAVPSPFSVEQRPCRRLILATIFRTNSASRVAEIYVWNAGIKLCGKKLRAVLLIFDYTPPVICCDNH